MNKIPVPIRLIELHPFVSSTSMIWPAVFPLFHTPSEPIHFISTPVHLIAYLLITVVIYYLSL